MKNKKLNKNKSNQAKGTRRKSLTWLSSIVVIITFLAGVAEFTGINLNDLFSNKDSRVKDNISTTGPISPAVKSEGDVIITFGKVDSTYLRKVSEKSKKKHMSSTSESNFNIKTEGEMSPAVEGENVSIIYGIEKFR